MKPSAPHVHLSFGKLSKYRLIVKYSEARAGFLYNIKIRNSGTGETMIKEKVDLMDHYVMNFNEKTDYQ